MTRVQRHPEVIYTDLVDGAVLLHGETKFFYSLDPVGTTIWRLLDETNTVDGLVRRLVAEYEVSPELARTCLSEFIRQLEQEQLVTPDGLAGAPAGEPSDIAPSDTAREARKRFDRPELIKHDEPLHAVVMNPFDPQLPLAE